MSEPKFTPPTNGDDAELLCPGCGNNYLHHEVVEIFERGEDKSQGVHVVVSDGKASIDTSMKGNPSMRRHGLRIEFSCEHCSDRSVFELSQHKGITNVTFTVLDDIGIQE